MFNEILLMLKSSLLYLTIGKYSYIYHIKLKILLFSSPNMLLISSYFHFLNRNTIRFDVFDRVITRDVFEPLEAHFDEYDAGIR